jgi:hypothetical protein
VLRAIEQALEHRVPQIEQRQIANLPAIIGSIGAGMFGGSGPESLALAAAGGMAAHAITDPRYIAQAALTMKQAGDRMQGLAKTSKALAPYATMATFARTVNSETPTADEARKRGQIATTAVTEVTEQPGFEGLTLDQQMQAIDRAVTDVALLTGGVATVTKQKDRASRIIRGLKAAQTTERP